MFAIVAAFIVIALIICFFVGAIGIFGVSLLAIGGSVSRSEKARAGVRAADAIFLKSNGRSRDESNRQQAKALGLSLGGFLALTPAARTRELHSKLRSLGATEMQINGAGQGEKNDFLLGLSALPSDAEIAHRREREFLAAFGCTRVQQETRFAAKARMSVAEWQALPYEVQLSVRGRLFAAGGRPLVFEDADAEFQRATLAGVLTDAEWGLIPIETRTERAETYLSSRPAGITLQKG